MNHPIPLSLPTPFAVGPVNAYLLLGEEPTLVDAGPRTDEAWEALLSGLAVQGLAPRDLRHIFITHPHADHYGNGRRLAEAAPDAAVLAPDVAHARPMLLDLDEEWERQIEFTRRALVASGVPEALAAQSRPRLGLYRHYGSAVPVTHWVCPGEQITLTDGDDWEVVALPGHSMAQVGLRHAATARFIAADHLLPAISSNALLEPPAPGETRRPRALPRYADTLRWTAALPSHHIFPGHGLPFYDQRPLIAQRLQGMEERAARLLMALHERPRTVLDLTFLLFPKLDADQIFLGISEIVGHLDLLEARGQVAFRGQPVREYHVTGSEGGGDAE